MADCMSISTAESHHPSSNNPGSHTHLGSHGVHCGLTISRHEHHSQAQALHRTPRAPTLISHSFVVCQTPARRPARLVAPECKVHPRECALPTDFVCRNPTLTCRRCTVSMASGRSVSATPTAPTMPRPSTPTQTTAAAAVTPSSVPHSGAAARAAVLVCRHALSLVVSHLDTRLDEREGEGEGNRVGGSRVSEDLRPLAPSAVNKREEWCSDGVQDGGAEEAL